MKRTVTSGAVVLLAVAVATALTEASQALGAELTFEWYVAAVACVAWLSGRRPGIATAILASATIDFLLLPFHHFSFGMGLEDAARLAVFVGLALLVVRLVARRQRAEEDRAARERLLATVAHELGNMMYALRTWTTALQRDALHADQVEHSARALAETADGITKLAGDLLDWSRVALGTIYLEPADVDLADVVRDAVEAVRSHATDRGVTLRASLAAAPVHADPHRLHQVALNVLMTSLASTTAGGEVDVAVHVVAHRVVFAVRDSGRGIPPELLRGPFDVETLRTRQTSFGVGLALARDLVRAHGGEVSVENGGIGCGTTVVVELPTGAWAAAPTPITLAMPVPSA